MEILNKTGLSRLIENIFNTFSKIGHTHTVSQITNFPKIPTKTSELTNDSGFKTTDNNTTYSISKSGSSVVLTGSDKSSTSVSFSASDVGADVSGAASTALNNAKSYTDTEIEEAVASIQSKLDAKVPTNRTINGKALSQNISLSASDVGADASGAANTALTNAKSYTDTEISELSTSVQSKLDAKVPTSRTVNGKALSTNITLTASDVGADASGAANTALTNAKKYTDDQLATIPTESATTDEILDFIGDGISEVLIDYEIATVSEVQNYINV